jgi:hypothetical protein
VAVYKGRKTNPRRVDCCAVGCEGEMLDRTVKELNADGWSIRQVYQEAPGDRYRILGQRETPVTADEVPANAAWLTD